MKLPLCQCGCGKQVRLSSHQFLHGHNVLISEVREKRRQSLKGRVVSKATREKIRKSELGKCVSLETRRKMSQLRKGKPLQHKENCLCCICKAKRGDLSPLCIKGRTVSKATREKLRKASLNQVHRKGFKPSATTRAKMSVISKQHWQSPEYISAQMRARGCFPNKTELFLLRILEVISPGEWLYVGDGKYKSFILSGKVPDFVHRTKKLIIELFGDYWHSQELTGMPKEQHIQERIECFQKSGYQTLIIWEHELQEISTVSKRISSFGETPCQHP